MRIWHQSATVLESLPEYAASLARQYAEVGRPDTEVVLHGVPPGTYGSSSPAQVIPYPAERHRIAQIVLDQVRNAEREGFDGVMLATFVEPALREARSALDIPVTSMAESALVAGFSAAGRVGLVTLSPLSVHMLQEIVDRHRFGPRVAAIVTLDPPFTEFEMHHAFEDPAPLEKAFEDASRQAIAAGADLIIPGEGVLNEFLVHAGKQEVDSVGVMNSTAMSLLHTEMLVESYRKAGLRTGRRWQHPRVPSEVQRDLEAPATIAAGGA